MALTQAELGARLRASREAVGLTQEQVAARLELSRSSIAQIELGNRCVSGLELDGLAGLYGKDLRDLLAEDFDVKDDALTALFRAVPGALQGAEVRERLSKCVRLGRSLADLQSMLSIRHDVSVPTYPQDPPANTLEAIRQGEFVAAEERKRLGLGTGPLPNLVELLESQGIYNGIVDLPEDVSGITLFEPRVGIVVVVNGANAGLRRRFSYAHEYGHVLMDRGRSALVSKNSEHGEAVEVRANAFAASFLMPLDGVKRFCERLGKGMAGRERAEVFDERAALRAEKRTVGRLQQLQLYDVVLLANHFGVSRPTALYRLKNLRLIGKTEFQRLLLLDEGGAGQRLAVTLGLRYPDFENQRSELTQRLLGLALEALRRGEITQAKFEELAGLVDKGRAEALRLVNDAGIGGEIPVEAVVPDA